jgi:hypothetical protein
MASKRNVINVINGNNGEKRESWQWRKPAAASISSGIGAMAEKANENYRHQCEMAWHGVKMAAAALINGGWRNIVKANRQWRRNIEAWRGHQWRQ